jgi:hypothetical protein
MKSIITWDMTLCSLLSCNRRFGGTYLHFVGPEVGGDVFLRNVGCNSTDYTASYPRWWYSCQTLEYFKSVMLVNSEVMEWAKGRKCKGKRAERSCPMLVQIPCGVTIWNWDLSVGMPSYVSEDQLHYVVENLGTYTRFSSLTSQQLLMIRPSSFLKGGYMKQWSVHHILFI